ncbi:type II toxin-antitoxin system HicB family antitoxin [Candidatus Micrarchaeota archaeon]|nr:type II toxin-antitoxin system HicB family antitoxin [Candidatus Micrarchaeota archaeon]
MYNLSAVIEKEESLYVAHCLELQVTSQGKTIEEALENLKEAAELYLEHASPEEIEDLQKAHAKNPIIATISVGN